MQLIATVAADLGLNRPVVGHTYVTRDAGLFGPKIEVLEVSGKHVRYRKYTPYSSFTDSCTVGLFAWMFTKAPE